MDVHSLRDDTKRDLHQDTPSEIYRKYGDRFVGEVGMGGQYYALIRYFASTESEFEKLDAAIGGTSGAFSAQAEFSRTIEKLHEYQSELAWHHLEGATGGYPNKD
jgi:hypothetical protein